jgi:glutathione peroxidase
MYEKYKDDGFDIWAFPCNQFDNGEPGTDREVRDRINKTFRPKFKLFSKIDVNGPNTHDVFKFLRGTSALFDRKENVVKPIYWNFAKFLINEYGQVLYYFDSRHDVELIEPYIYSLVHKESMSIEKMNEDFTLDDYDKYLK